MAGQDESGNIINSLSTVVKLESVFNAPLGPCQASVSGDPEVLYTPSTGATGNSSLRFVSPNFQFNWDTTTAVTDDPRIAGTDVTGIGCYTVLIYLSDAPSKARMTTSVQLK